jgi:hypothetical protein
VAVWRWRLQAHWLTLIEDKHTTATLLRPWQALQYLVK